MAQIHFSELVTGLKILYITIMEATSEGLIYSFRMNYTTFMMCIAVPNTGGNHEAVV